MTDIDAIRERLLARRAELARRVTATDADLRHEREPISPDFAEQAVQRENEDVLRGIGLSSRDSLQRVNMALARLDQGEYFQCAQCGCDIEPSRLQAVPEADRCMRCAE